MTHLRNGRQRGAKAVAARMITYRVGWRAYGVGPDGTPALIAVGVDTFHCSSIEKAMKLAAQEVPKMIFEPDAQVGIRYVKEAK